MGFVSQQNPGQLWSKEDGKNFALLLRPSWLSGLLTVVISLGVVIGAAALLYYNGSSWQQLISEQRHTSSEVTNNLTAFETKVNSNPFVSSLPLLIFWAGVGVIVYSFIIAIMEMFHNALELKQEMRYIHANRPLLLRQALLHLLLRGIFLSAWVFFVSATLHTILPYVIALTYAGSGNLGWLYNSTYLIGAILVSMICLHLHTVLLRLLALKPRLFGQSLSA